MPPSGINISASSYITYTWISYSLMDKICIILFYDDLVNEMPMATSQWMFKNGDKYGYLWKSKIFWRSSGDFKSVISRAMNELETSRLVQSIERRQSYILSTGNFVLTHSQPSLALDLSQKPLKSPMPPSGINISASSYITYTWISFTLIDKVIIM
jgi:hypothetical protein